MAEAGAEEAVVKHLAPVRPVPAGSGERQKLKALRDLSAYERGLREKQGCEDARAGGGGRQSRDGAPS